MKEAFVIIFGVMLIFAMGWFLGFSSGHMRGMEDANEISKKVDCEFNYSYKPLNEIPGKCLKYFDIKQK